MTKKHPNTHAFKKLYYAKNGKRLSDEEAAQHFEHLTFLIYIAYGSSRLASFKAGKCPHCEKRIDHNALTSDLEQREYLISGLCKRCQDTLFQEHDGIKVLDKRNCMGASQRV